MAVRWLGKIKLSQIYYSGDQNEIQYFLCQKTSLLLDAFARSVSEKRTGTTNFYKHLRNRVVCCIMGEEIAFGRLILCLIILRAMDGTTGARSV